MAGRRQQAERQVLEIIDGESEWMLEAILDRRVVKKITLTEAVQPLVTVIRRGRASTTVLPSQEVTRTKMVPVTEYRMKWKRWSDAPCRWLTVTIEMNR